MTDAEPESDAELLQRCAEGDADAWAAFVDRFGPLLAALAQRMLERRGGPRGRAAVDEVVADVFLALLRRDRILLKRYDPTWRVSTYLGVLCRTEVGRLLRRRRRTHAPLEATDEPESVGLSPEASLEAKEDHGRRVELLREALTKVPPRDRLLLELRYIDGLDYRALAEALAVSEESVGSLLSRARRRLAQAAPELDPG